MFLILGVGGEGGRFPDAFRGARADSVITAGGHVTTANDFRKVFEQQKQHYEQQTKQTYTTEFLVQNGFDQQLLNQIALDDAQAEMLARAGVDPAASLIDAQIRQIPVAFDRVTGKFSEQQFTQFLASQGLTPREVQADLTDELAERHFTAALAANYQAPRAFAALTAIAALQSRDVSYFTLDPRAVVQPLPPTDAQLQAFETAHAAQLTRPELRVVTLVRFSAAALAPTVAVTASDIQKEFEARKNGLSTPETRTIILIPVKTAAEGAEAAARLTKGEDPAAIAKAFRVAPVIYADKPRTAIPDTKLAAAAFALKEGQVSGPVQGGSLGLAAVEGDQDHRGHDRDAGYGQGQDRGRPQRQGGEGQGLSTQPEVRRRAPGWRRHRRRSPKGRRCDGDRGALQRGGSGRHGQGHSPHRRQDRQIGFRHARRGRLRHPGHRPW